MEFGRCRFTGEWFDWDYSLHSNKEQISRQGWAMTYPFEFDVDDDTQTAQFSSTSDLPYYITALHKCTCYDFQERKLPCKHIYRLAVELGLIEIFNRPSFDKDKLEEAKASDDIDNHPEQVKRQKSALDKKCKPKEINKDNKTAVFTGSGKVPYETTMDTCTCRDYFVRKLPCKHIYRLRYELSK